MQTHRTRRFAAAVAALAMTVATTALAKTPTPKSALHRLDRNDAKAPVALTPAQIDPQRLRAHVAFLAHDELAGRGTGSDGIDLAAGYIAGQFAAAGLLPAGPDGTYFQNFEVVASGKLSEQTSLSCEGVADAIVLDADFRPFDFSQTGSFAGDLAFVGYGITEPDEKYDDYANLDVDGKVVLMIRREPDFLAPDRGSSSHASFESKIELAKKNGAFAVLIANKDDGEEDRLRRFWPRGMTYGLPAVHVTRELASTLLARGGHPPIEELQERIETDKKPASAFVKTATVKGTVAYELETMVGRNVIGLLPGTGSASGSHVVIGGHYDHLGTRGGDIYNGADDNASGTAGVIELARAFAGNPRRNRSLLFMAYSGEEIGLLGSKHYVAAPTVPLETLSSMINMDMIGKLAQNGSGERLTIHGLGTGSSFKGLVEKYTTAAGLTYDADDSARGPSDHASFYEGGVPSLFFFTGVHEDYHQPGDDTDKVDFDGAARIVGLVHGIAADLVNAEAGPAFASVDHMAIINRGSVGGPPRVVMGIMPDMEDSGDGGWRVAQVFPESGAARAGMKSGDRIITIEGEAIGGLQDYRKITKNKKPGDTIAVTVRRGDQQIDLSVELSSAG